MKCYFDLKRKCKYPPTCQGVCDTVVQARQNVFRTSSEQLRHRKLLYRRLLSLRKWDIPRNELLRDCLSVVNSLCRERCLDHRGNFAFNQQISRSRSLFSRRRPHNPSVLPFRVSIPTHPPKCRPQSLS